MKVHLLKASALFLIIIGAVFSSYAQIYIKVRPGPPVLRVRPAMPGPRHVWVYGDYQTRKGQYYYNEGYWSVPPPHKSAYVEGRWKHRRGGWIWIPGHWK